MRISTSQFYDASTTNYQRIYAATVADGQTVSSGLRVNTAADDPTGAANLLQLGQESSMLGQYQANMTSATNTMTQSETNLTSIQNALQSARELVLSGANGTLTDKDRQAKAAELTQLQAQVLSLMNGQDANGKYIFSGSKTSTPPYSQNSDGTYSYNGDQSSINVPIGTNLSVATNTTGWAAFEQATNTAPASSTMTSPAVDDGRVSLSAGQVTDTSTFNSSFASGQPYTVSFLSSTSFKITDAGGNDVTTDSSSNGAFSSANAEPQSITFRGMTLGLNVNLSSADSATTATADAAVAGHSFQLAETPDTFSTSRSPGNASSSVITSATESNAAAYNSTFPASGAVLKFTSATAFDLYAAPVTANSQPVSSGTLSGTTATVAGVDFTLSGAPAAGDQFTVQPNSHQTQNVLDTLSSIIKALNTPSDGNAVATQQLQATLDAGLGNLTSAMNQVSSANSNSGARRNIVTDQSGTNNTLTIANTTKQGEIANADPVAAITALTLQQTMLQAAQLAFSKISQLALFNKL
jgi:flagellar hook-associated protein 3 FlgL